MCCVALLVFSKVAAGGHHPSVSAGMQVEEDGRSLTGQPPSGNVQPFLVMTMTKTKTNTKTKTGHTGWSSSDWILPSDKVPPNNSACDPDISYASL